MKAINILITLVIWSTSTIAQISDTTRLKEIIIRAKEPIVRHEAGKIIFNLQADAQSKVSSVLDMMRNVPHLSVDAEENVLLNGSKAFKIFINGKPSGLFMGNPKDVLRSIPASTVKSIEVITNPPARYDAEGLAGIINIVLIKQVHNGYKGSINIKEKAPVGGPGIGGTFTLKHGKMMISSITGANTHNTPATKNEQKRIGTGSFLTELEQSATKQSRGNTIYAGAELRYEIDSLHLITGEVSGHRSTLKGLSAQTTTLTAPRNAQYYRVDNASSALDNNMEVAVNYHQSFKDDKERLLTASYRLAKEEAQTQNDNLFSDKINYILPDYRQYNSEGFTEQTVQVDYMQPIHKLSIEGGLKGIARVHLSDFHQENKETITGRYKKDDLLSNTFSNEQYILAFYNSYTYKTAQWQLKAGTRIEQTLVKSNSSQGMVSSQYRYLNVLPSIFINRKLTSKSSLSFSYTQRIQRPNTEELNPFVNRSNPAFVFGGNPYLRPITSDVCQLSYLVSGKATLNVAVGSMFFQNVFNSITTYDATTQVSFTRYENYGGGRVLKLNISLNYPVDNNWNFTLNSDIRHVKVYAKTFQNSGLDVYVYASGSHNFKKGWRVNTDITYKKGGILLPIGRINGFTATSMSVNKTLLQSKLSVAASVSNPFTRYRYIEETITGSNFSQTSHRQVYFRQFTISLDYHFGRLKEN